ncbi:MAG: NAD-dependent epimerase/dehydratase family protein [Verrucomicrobiota bacterium]
MRVLLGGHGYLGKAIERMFRDAGWEVVPVSLHGDDGAMPCDIADAAAVAALPDVDCVVHCAASGRGGAEAYERVYRDGCQNLVRRYPGLPLLFTSSTSVYAQTDGAEVNEECITEPDRETGKILRAAEQIVLENGGAVARLAGIYGPGRSVILEKFLTGASVIEEDGRRLINQIHRDDAASAVFHLVSQNLRGIFNVCDDAPTSQLALHAGLARQFGKPLPPAGPRDPKRKRGWTHKRVSNAKLRATGWRPRFPSFLTAAEEIAATLPKP